MLTMDAPTINSLPDNGPPDDGEIVPQPPVPSSSKCSICRTRDLVEAPGWHDREGRPTGLMVCPHCDGHVCEMKCDHGPIQPSFSGLAP